MDIRELLLKDVMIMDLKATDKAGVIDEMTAKYQEQGIIDDLDLYRADILKRESESTTGIGDGIAMPHAKDKAVKRATVLFAKSDAGVDFNALDGQPVHLFFMIAAPEGANNTHLQALAALSSLLINPELVAALKKRKRLMMCKNYSQMHKRLKKPKIKLTKKPNKPRCKQPLRQPPLLIALTSLRSRPAQLVSPTLTWPKPL